MHWTQQKNVHLQAFGQPDIFKVSFNNNNNNKKSHMQLFEINHKNKSTFKDLKI